MGSATLTLAGVVTGLPQGQQTVNVQWVLPNAVGVWLYPVLAAGDNAIGVPTGASTMLIIPPDNNAVGFTVKDVPGDAGSYAHPQLPYFRTLAQTVTTVYISAMQTMNSPVSIAFW
jgi:hypothetical protein